MPRPSFRIKVKGNTLEASRFVMELARDQVPFATAAALTELAREARDAQRVAIRERFTVRSKRFASTFRHTPAEKRDWPKTASVVGVLDEWAARHEEGGTVTPSKAGRWAIPGVIKRTRSGKIRRERKPSALIAAGIAFERDDAILLRRKGSKRLRLAYTLSRRARLDKRLKMGETVRLVATVRYGPLFKKWLLRALN